jgi:hypothetical protein
MLIGAAERVKRGGFELLNNLYLDPDPADCRPALLHFPSPRTWL